MIDPLNCVRYILSEDIDLFNQKLITRLSERFPGIFLIHRESDINHNRVLYPIDALPPLLGTNCIDGTPTIKSSTNTDFNSRAA